MTDGTTAALAEHKQHAVCHWCFFCYPTVCCLERSPKAASAAGQPWRSMARLPDPSFDDVSLAVAAYCAAVPAVLAGVLRSSALLALFFCAFW